MRLEPLCEMQLAYQEDAAIGSKFVLIRPFGGEEGTGYGGGDGTVTGEKLSGSVRWINHPHRRSDSIMLPKVYGVITTDDGAQVLFTLDGGRTLFVGARGDQLLLVTFTAEDERYRWLNNAFCVLEGIYYAQAMDMTMQIYQCINELFEDSQRKRNPHIDPLQRLFVVMPGANLLGGEFFDLIATVETGSPIVIQPGVIYGEGML